MGPVGKGCIESSGCATEGNMFEMASGVEFISLRASLTVDVSSEGVHIRVGELIGSAVNLFRRCKGSNSVDSDSGTPLPYAGLVEL